MEVLQVVCSIAEEASGPSVTVPSLCEALEEAGTRSTLHVLGPAPESWARRIRIAQHPRRSFPSHLGVSPEMRRALEEASARADIIHGHGLWQMPNVYPAWAARKTGCRLITSPRGTLSDWALNHSYWVKRCMWWAFQGKALRQAACLHATAEIEFDEIRKLGLRTPVAIIPNGISVPARRAKAAPEGSARRLLYLGRLHPKKGLDMLIKAWRNVQTSAPDWVLEIVGTDDGRYQGELQELAQSIGAERIHFPGPRFGIQKTEAYRQADLFVLPTHSENFGMVVAEALAAGTPSIVTRGAPWEGLEREECGWWIEIGEGPLTECLRHTLALSRDRLSDMGERGRVWMERDFSWTKVGQMMHETYRWILGGGIAPSWVRGAA